MDEIDKKLAMNIHFYRKENQLNIFSAFFRKQISVRKKHHIFRSHKCYKLKILYHLI
jgi:hypothetical protein